jgi:8-amino-7-oxononanoate synthase
MVPAAAIAALDLVDAQPQIVSRLRQRIADFRARSDAIGLRLGESTTAIQPLVLGDAAWAVDASQRLLERGFLVPAIRPPTVPEGTSRLRVSLSAAHSREDVERLAEALAQTLAS